MAAVVLPTGIAITPVQQVGNQAIVEIPQPPTLRIEIPAPLPPQFTITSGDLDDDEHAELLGSPVPSPSPSPIAVPMTGQSYFSPSPTMGFASLQLSSPNLDAMTLQLPLSPGAALSPTGTTTSDPEYVSAMSSPLLLPTQPLTVEKAHERPVSAPVLPPRHPGHTLANSTLGFISSQIPNVSDTVVLEQASTEEELWEAYQDLWVEYNPSPPLANLIQGRHPKFSRTFLIPNCLRGRKLAGQWRDDDDPNSERKESFKSAPSIL